MRARVFRLDRGEVATRNLYTPNGGTKGDSTVNVLIACEFSGVVRRAFQARGHYAISCDLLPAEDGEKWNHYQGDVRSLLQKTGWDLMIAHPPCTYLSTCDNRHQHETGRAALRDEAFAFFMELWCAPIPRICMENPQGRLSTLFRKPDQTIHPWYFGDPKMKRTCLWLKNLPPLTYDLAQYTKPEPLYWTPKGEPKHWCNKTKEHGRGRSGKERSVTSGAIAEAMAEQWGLKTGLAAHNKTPGV